MVIEMRILLIQTKIKNIPKAILGLCGIVKIHAQNYEILMQKMEIISADLDFSS